MKPRTGWGISVPKGIPDSIPQDHKTNP